MPVVPEYNSQIQPQGFPSIRVPDDTPLSALGGGQAAAGLTNSQMELGRSIESEMIKQKREADQMLSLGVETEMAPIETDLVSGPNGALSKSGLDAMNQPEAVAERYQKIAEEKINKIPSADARNLATQRLKDNQSRIYSTVMTHAARETEVLKDRTDMNFVENERNAAIKSGNMLRIADAHENILSTLRSYGVRKGMNEEQLTTISNKAISGLHSGVVTSLLTKDKYPAAKKYYDATFKDILPEDEQNLSRYMKEGGDRYKVQGLSDEFFAKYPDKGEAQPEVDKIQDPEIRKSLNSDLDYRYSQKRQQLDVAQKNVYLDGVSQSMSRPGVPASQSVDSVTWSNMTPAQKKSCEDAANPPANDNDKAWLEFTGLGADGMAGIDKATFTEKYWSKMSPRQRLKAEAYYSNAREAAANPEKAVKSKFDQSREEMIDYVLTNRKIIQAGLTRNEIKNDSNLSKIHGDFSEAVSKQVAVFEATKGSEATNSEFKEIANGVAQKKFYEEGSLYGYKVKPAFNLSEEDYKKISISGLEKERPGSTERMKNYLRSKGQATSTENMGLLYREINNDPKVEKLILGQ